MQMKAKHEYPETPPEINILEGNGSVTRGLCAPNYKSVNVHFLRIRLRFVPHFILLTSLKCEVSESLFVE